MKNYYVIVLAFITVCCYNPPRASANQSFPIIIQKEESVSLVSADEFQSALSCHRFSETRNWIKLSVGGRWHEEGNEG